MICFCRLATRRCSDPLGPPGGEWASVAVQTSVWLANKRQGTRDKATLVLVSSTCRPLEHWRADATVAPVGTPLWTPPAGREGKLPVAIAYAATLALSHRTCPPAMSRAKSPSGGFANKTRQPARHRLRSPAAPCYSNWIALLDRSRWPAAALCDADSRAHAPQRPSRPSFLATDDAHRRQIRPMAPSICSSANTSIYDRQPRA